MHAPAPRRGARQRAGGVGAATQSILVAATLLAGSALATPGQAHDLREALTMAYTSNPTLAAAREQQKAVDEGVPLARADGLPQVSGTASETEFVVQNPLQTPAPKRVLALSGSFSVPLYQGGAVRNAIKAAETRVTAGQSSLAGTESSVFTQVVGAYMDVILGEAVVRFNRANVQSLDANLQATQDRFQIGEVTRTDVAQSQSRLALAQGQLRSAEAELVTAREQYIAIIGEPPGDLAPPPPLPGLPDNADAAVATALSANPDLAAARAQSRAATYDVHAAEAGRLPKLSIVGGAEHDDYLRSLKIDGNVGPVPQTADSATVGVTATIPLFSGGRTTANVRRAEATAGAALNSEIGTERAVIASVRAAWSSWQASNEIIASTQTALDAAKLSLEGVRAENSVGNRTILDILNAEQELLNSEVQLVTAQRNAYVAGFGLLAAMGHAQAKDLGLDSGGPLYDVDAHYRATRGDLWDWGGDGMPQAPQAFTGATRTVDTPAQGSAVKGDSVQGGSAASPSVAPKP